MDTFDIYEVMQSVNNYFRIRGAARRGTFEIKDNSLELDFLKDGQYYIVEGSVFNDGLHLYPETFETDEVFTGEISPCAIDPAFLKVCGEIKEWREKFEKTAMSPYKSEGYENYNYQKIGGDDSTVDWSKIFKGKLNRWRKV